MDDNGRHILHEFMTGQRPAAKSNKWINLILWILIISLLGVLGYLLIHG